MRYLTLAWTGFVAAGLVLATSSETRAQPLDKAAVREFMLTAEIVEAVPISKGVTNPWRLTLRDGEIAHDVAFQSVNEKRDRKRLGRRQELRFVDAYRYNIAASRIAELLGIDHMMPVTVERDWNGTRGAMTWWIDDVMMDEEVRLDERRWAPVGAGHAGTQPAVLADAGLRGVGVRHQS